MASAPPAAMSSTDEMALREAFLQVCGVELPPEAASRLLLLAARHSVDGVTVAHMWESFSATRQQQVDTELAVDSFAAWLEQQRPKTRVPPPLSMHSPGVLAQNATLAPALPAAAVGGLPARPAGTAFAARGAKLQAEVVLNGHLPHLAAAAAVHVALRSQATSLQAEEKQRIMHERTETRVEWLEYRLSSFAQAAAASLGVPPATQPLHVASSDTCTVAGRVVGDSDAYAAGRLNANSILLEGSHQHSAGARVRLELQHLPHYSIFPGQCVLVRGSNPSGFCLVADAMVTGVPLSPPDAACPLPDGGTIIIAAGPFTCAGDMLYEPLTELLAYCERMQPTVVVLCGPFVDVEHPLCSAGAIDTTFDELFQTKVAQPLFQFMGSNAGVMVVMQPAGGREAAHTPVFPTPPLSPSVAPSTQLICAANPDVVLMHPSCGSALQLAACSADVLKALSSGEVFAPPLSGSYGFEHDRLARLCGHVLGQQCFFPLFPAPQGTCMDTTHAVAGDLAITQAPHLLLLPSDLAPFARAVATGVTGSQSSSAMSVDEGDQTGTGHATWFDATSNCAAKTLATTHDTVCVNPGRLARGHLGGTFAVVTVHPQHADGVAPFSTRARVDIVRV